ncbi:hypothetical protein VULLAG_LOCUS4781 [Vulpes lagopus]
MSFTGNWSSRSPQLVLSSPQALTGAVSTIKFLSEAFLGRHFEAVELEGSEPEPGDLFPFRLLSPTGRCAGPTWVCTVATGRSSTLKGQRPMLRSRSLWRVLRRRGGVDRVALERRMREAMDADPLPYHPTRSNCVHFARRLLGRMPILDPLQIDSGPINSVSVDLNLAMD